MHSHISHIANRLNLFAFDIVPPWKFAQKVCCFSRFNTQTICSVIAATIWFTLATQTLCVKRKPSETNSSSESTTMQRSHGIRALQCSHRKSGKSCASKHHLTSPRNTSRADKTSKYGPTSTHLWYSSDFYRPHIIYSRVVRCLISSQVHVLPLTQAAWASSDKRLILLSLVYDVRGVTLTNQLIAQQILFVAVKWSKRSSGSTRLLRMPLT